MATLPIIPVWPQPIENSNWSFDFDSRLKRMSTVPFSSIGLRADIHVFRVEVAGLGDFTSRTHHRKARAGSSTNFSIKNLFHRLIPRHNTLGRRADVHHIGTDQRPLLPGIFSIVPRPVVSAASAPTHCRYPRFYSRQTGVNSSFYNSRWSAIHTTSATGYGLRTLATTTTRIPIRAPTTQTGAQMLGLPWDSASALNCPRLLHIHPAELPDTTGTISRTGNTSTT